MPNPPLSDHIADQLADPLSALAAMVIVSRRHPGMVQWVAFAFSSSPTLQKRKNHEKFCSARSFAKFRGVLAQPRREAETGRMGVFGSTTVEPARSIRWQQCQDKREPWREYFPFTFTEMLKCLCAISFGTK
jgi:hypothetical protein